VSDGGYVFRAQLDALRNALEEARAYVYNVAVEHRRNWRGETAEDVLARIDAALADSNWCKRRTT
jgi:hypothetical protein